MDGIRFDLVQRAPQPRRIPQIQAAPSPKPSHRDSAWIEIANTAHSVRVQQPELVFVPGVQGVRSELERHAFLPRRHKRVQKVNDSDRCHPVLAYPLTKNPPES
jgi:hypothetical protein